MTVSCFAFMIPIYAQKTWTLDQCIKYAWENNIQLKKQDLQTESSKTSFKQSQIALLPDLYAGGSYGWNLGRSVNPYTNEFSNNVANASIYMQSTLVLFNGMQQIHTIAQNKTLLEKSFKDYAKAKNDLGLQIATIYLQILFNDENLNVAQKQQDMSHLQSEKMIRLVEVGNKSKGDLLLMQAQEANDKYNVITAKNNLSISYLTLAQLLELKNSDDFKIQIPDSLKIENDKTLSSVDEIYKAAESILPQVKSAELDLRSSEQGLLVTKGQYSPQLNLVGAYGSGYTDQNPSGFWSQISDNDHKSLTFNLNIPIFTKYQTKSRISFAHIKVLDSQYTLELTRKSLYKEIQSAHADAVGALEKYYAAIEAVRSNEEAVKYSQQKFDVGMLSAVDYNTAKNNLTKANSDLIQSKYTYVFKLKILDFYKGLPIVL